MMMDKMMGKEDSSGSDDMKKEAKLKVLKHLKDMASGMMGSGLDKMKKVTVAAPDSKGLEMGLDKAKSMMDPKTAMMDAMKDPMEAGENEDPSMHDDESAEMEAMNPEEIDQMIQKLQEMKSKKMMSHE